MVTLQRILLLLPLLLTPILEAFDYTRDIKPILKERCASCHGAIKQKADLRLDAGQLIPPSIHKDILARIVSADKDERMPPEGARLSNEQIELLKGWIAAGAPHPPDEPVPKNPADHWSFQPVRRPQIPASHHPHPVDAFLFRKNPAPPQTTGSALLRRVYLDLIGLPPTPEEQVHFANDPELEPLIDRLLARPEHGERWARHWLDVARYADTNGYERDAEKPFVWRYRDYVIQSINDDKPFNRFTLEQIAGDELPDASLASRIATGFLRLGHWDDEPAAPPQIAMTNLTTSSAPLDRHSSD